MQPTATPSGWCWNACMPFRWPTCINFSSNAWRWTPAPESTQTMNTDVIIIGGSYAGLSAALQLARARRRITVVDAGRRRNRFASHSHGFLGRDGHSPSAIADEARQQLLAYATVRWLAGEATQASQATGGFD